jgi:dipeptidyl-peptidase-4
MVTSRDIIYGFIDGRGSGRQTTELLFQVYRQLGSVEIEDQITAAKYDTYLLDLTNNAGKSATQ